jgi:tetratricopeptide (TPR) repeat protein
MAGKGFNLIKRVEQILSKQRSNAMNTRLSFKTIVFVCLAVLTFSIAGIHARVSTVKSDDTDKVLQEPLKEINTVTTTYEDQKPAKENIPEPKAVDEPDMSQPILITKTTPQKELLDIQTQENKEPVMVIASVDMNAMNKIEKPIDIVDVQSYDEPALMNVVEDNIALTQNETAEGPNLHSATVPDNAISNVTPEDASNDPKKVDIGTAITDLSRQIEVNGSDARLYILRGNHYMDKQDYEQAIKDYTKAIKINPDDAAAYNIRGLAYVNASKEHYANRMEYINQGKSWANKEEYKQRMKRDKQADQFFKKAIKDYKKAIKIDPVNINAYINRGNAYFAKQSYPQAIADYTRAIKIDPQYSLAYLSRGIAHLQFQYGRKFSKAIEDFSKVLDLDGPDAGTYLLRGNAYYSDGEYRQAINDYSKALEINPDLINAYNNRGRVYGEIGELDKAINDYSKAIEIISERPDAFINPIFYSKAGQDLNSRIINSTNSNSSYFHYTFGPESQMFEGLLSRNMVLESLASYINRGLAYEKKGQLDKAISDFSRVIEKDPNNALAYLYRSEIYRKMGNEVEYKNDLNMTKKYSNEYYYLHVPINRPGYWEGSPSPVSSAYHQLKKILNYDSLPKEIEPSILPGIPNVRE